MGGRVQLPGGVKEGRPKDRSLRKEWGVDIGRKDPVGCLRGAKVLGGQLGVSTV